MRSIYINEEPDGSWRITVGVMGGEQWGAIMSAATIWSAVHIYTNMGSRLIGVDWHLIPRPNAVTEPEGSMARLKKEGERLANLEASLARMDDEIDEAAKYDEGSTA